MTVNCEHCGETYPDVHPAVLSLTAGQVGPFCDGCFELHPLVIKYEVEYLLADLFGGAS